MSEGTAAALGLKTVRGDVPPTTAYLMVGGSCQHNCAFCAQARGAAAGADRLARVTWPEYPEDEVLAALVARADRQDGPIRRVCVQTVAGEAGRCELAMLLRGMAGRLAAPVSASVYVRDLDQLGELFDLGLERAGLAIDAAGDGLYREIKGGSLTAGLEFLAAAARRFPGRISTHLIYGLGETERDFLELAYRCLAGGVTVGLFAFTPVRGTALADRRPPDLGGYRRVQAVVELMRRGILSPAELVFDHAGGLVGIKRQREELAPALADGRAFVTSGCENCNRPYYNERPGTIPYNYARAPAPEEVAAAINASGVLWLAVGGRGGGER